ncbi:Ppx/GppA phosphatase family protein [Agromyces atrinae]|uniref:Exopolyphosphatase/guanosine-5'-triphosphate, 3'-diphosphate pyrophosphatase n=1 Tax=Agromyces atrinae TaxID=592376 RepID=A0A4Q2M230_9MICO|nr:Ppx/GppA family phosphatase [Agromyces atrinae]NYD68816.1 exopolyphosphatase/guanosine-5'-triphosphate,3'-diphosphate pyrophosphatase [Agromyces atrinae]RXZ85111.1 Ppx/GppA family phosphatase [Agromyces atrinae]RXZ85808.1 Ppx/GppA family phosphatase [Agromyces atrinae]
MRLGVLDVGSNTVHLLIVDAHPGARPIPDSSHKSVLRLMRYLTDDGAISDDGVTAIVDAVRAAVRAGEAAGIEELLPFATSALREATNGAAVLALIAAETGVELQVLSGIDEARITFLAVRRWYGWSAADMLLFDIGGGSLEIAAGGDEYPEVALSLPLGAGRSTIGFLHDDPPTQAQMDALREHAASVLDDALPAFANLPRAAHISGSSKTIRSLARLAGSVVDGVGSLDRTLLRRAQLDDWIPRLARIPADARPALPGITVDRTFQIVAGGIVLTEAMRAFGVRELEVSPWALREGILLRYLDRLV